jgi:hypothetical protein
MRKRTIHVLNWDKYQARSDKELPWCKLWGRLFKTPWFQLLDDPEKFCTIAILDLARQFSNKISEELIFKGYLKGNYGLFMSEERISKLCKVLSDNEFLSDNCPTKVSLEGDKKDIDKKERERTDEKRPTNTPNSLEETKSYFVEINHPLEAEKFFDHFTANGWKVGGKSPMRDWKAAARNWTRNSKTFSNSSTSKPTSELDAILEKKRKENENAKLYA